MSSPKIGQAVGIGRLGYSYNVTSGALGDITSLDGILWQFAGGWASGINGTFSVYASADNANDPYEDTGIDITVVDGVKTILPEEVLNLAGSWIKLIGTAGDWILHGAS